MMLFNSPSIHGTLGIRKLNILVPNVQTMSAMLQRIDPNPLNLATKGILIGDTSHSIPVIIVALPKLQVRRPRTVAPILFKLAVPAVGVLPGEVVGFELAAGRFGLGWGVAAEVGGNAGGNGDLFEGGLPSAFEEDAAEDDDEEHGDEGEADEDEQLGGFADHFHAAADCELVGVIVFIAFEEEGLGVFGGELFVGEWWSGHACGWGR